MFTSGVFAITDDGTDYVDRAGFAAYAKTACEGCHGKHEAKKPRPETGPEVL